MERTAKFFERLTGRSPNLRCELGMDSGSVTAAVLDE
jgi:hypothetical protein